MSQSDNFSDFVKFSDSQKEVSLAIAKDETELKRLRDFLEGKHFKRATEVSQFLIYASDPCKLYFIASDFSKDLYDFILQYPTGQVEIFDAKRMKSSVVRPSYKGVSIVILMLKDTLLKFQRKFPILETVGITYQS